MLAAQGLEVVYRDVLLGLRGVSLEVHPGTIVAVLGANGSGKTTLLRSLTGLLDVHRGKVTKGAATFENMSLVGADPATIVRSGIAQVMEGRRIFPALTVDENLRTGSYTVRSGQQDDLETLGTDLGEQVQSDFLAFIGYVTQTCADELDLPTEEDLGELDPQQQ